MEVALTVITIASAVKDLVELAEKIRTSFEKVSDNLRKARALAGDITQTIKELCEFCEQHSAVLENDQNLRKALSELIDKLTLFNSNVGPLIPDPGPGPSPQLLRRVKGGFKAWRNSDRINASIQELKEEVKDCHLKFVLMSVARMRVKLNEVHDSTSEGLRVVKEGLDVLVAQNAVSIASQPPSSSSQRWITASNQSIAAFAQTSSSTSTPIWKTPSTTNGQIIRDTYLKTKIDFIANSLSEISSLGTIYSIKPLKEYENGFNVIHSPWLGYSSPESLHDGVVIYALQMCETLKEKRPMNTSIQKGAWHLVSLAIGLQSLGMYKEVVKMGKWAVSLFRTLVRVDEATYSPYLVLTLQNLAVYNCLAGDNDSALDAIEEAVRTSEGLQTPTAPGGILIQRGWALAVYAHLLSRIKKDYKRAIGLGEQSVKLMEEIHGIGSLPQPYKRVNGVVQVSRSFLTRLYEVLPSAHDIANYARALQGLSHSLMADGRPQEALDAKLRALPIFYDIPSLLPENADIELAGILYELVSQECKSLLPAKKILQYTEDCVRIYRRHTELDPSRFARLLCGALLEKGDALNTLNRGEDALEVFKEAANIMQQVIQDQRVYACFLDRIRSTFNRLKKYEEAVSVGAQLVLTYEAINNTVTESQADAYVSLCVNYQHARMFPQAVDAGKKAVQQCRVLAISQPNEWTWQIGQALAALADSLFSAGDHETALNEGHESMQIFERHINKTDPQCVRSYIFSLCMNAKFAVTVDDKHKATERMDDVLPRLRQLALDFPEKASITLLEVELNYGQNLNRLDHIQEARVYMEQLIAKWEAEEHLYVNKDFFTHWQIRALISYASILDNQGHTDLALMPIQKAADIGRPFSATSPMLASQTVKAMYKRAHLLVKLGRYDQGLVVAEGTLTFSRETKMYDSSHLVGALHVVGLAAHHTQAYGRVVEVSQEAVSIYRSADFEKYYDMDQRDFCPLSSCLQLLSSGHANRGNLELGLHCAEAAVDDAKAFPEKSRIPHTDLQQYYMEANGQLGAMYLASGKIDAARMAFEEMRVYYTEKVKVRPGLSGSLVSTLHRLGIIYCSNDRHDEGHAAAQEAKKYLDHLAEVLPGLHKLVFIAMHHELTTPSLQVLNIMKEALSCNHQSDLSF